VAALADGKGKVAKEPGQRRHRLPAPRAAALLGPWVAAAAGDTDGSLVRPQLRGDGGVDYFGQLGQAPCSSAPTATTRPRPTSRR
jgi:hypothetical protein